jgi:hypothetical protein
VAFVGDGKWRFMGKEPKNDKQLSSWLSLKVLKIMFGELTINVKSNVDYKTFQSNSITTIT